MAKKLVFGILLILLVIMGAGFIYFLNQISTPPSSDATEKYFVIKSGEGVKEISADLKKEGLITNDFVFHIYVWVKRYGSKLQAGEYSFAQNLNMVDLTRILVSGEALSKERIVKIIEGWNSQEIADYLVQFYLEDNKDRNKSQSDLEKEFKSKFLEAVATTDSRKLIPEKIYSFLSDKPADQGLEGFLFPDTYRIYKNSDVSHLIEKMLDNFNLKLTDDLRIEIKNQNKTIFEIVTLASIVEKEVRTSKDRKIAAGIFYKRLKQGIPLESDATVNYITGKQSLQPTIEDTKTESLYNTYLHPGLPPGPISNPGLDSIKAVIYPEDSDYLYFLTKPDGSTIFSKTYNEHLRNKAKYLE